VDNIKPPNVERFSSTTPIRHMPAAGATQAYGA